MANETKGKRAAKTRGNRDAPPEDMLGVGGMSELAGSPDDRRGFTGSPDDR